MGYNSNIDMKQAIKSLIGTAVIVRSRNEGVNFGILKDAGKGYVVLKNARRLWRHVPKDKNTSWYEGVANSGLTEGSKVSAPVKKKVIVEDYSMTVCSEIAVSSIKKFPTHEQS
jgi:hypothetical protein